MMRIGIDGHFLGSPMGGNKTQGESLSRGLLDILPQHVFVTVYTCAKCDQSEPASHGGVDFYRLRPGSALRRRSSSVVEGKPGETGDERRIRL